MYKTINSCVIGHQIGPQNGPFLDPFLDPFGALFCTQECPFGPGPGPFPAYWASDGLRRILQKWGSLGTSKTPHFVSKIVYFDAKAVRAPVKRSID